MQVANQKRYWSSLFITVGCAERSLVSLAHVGNYNEETIS